MNSASPCSGETRVTAATSSRARTRASSSLASAPVTAPLRNTVIAPQSSRCRSIRSRFIRVTHSPVGSRMATPRTTTVMSVPTRCCSNAPRLEKKL